MIAQPRQSRSTEELHPTAMIERPGPVLRWFFGRLFREIAFPEDGAAKIRSAAERGTVVYVVKTLSYIDYLYFSFAFLRLGLPLCRFANGVKTLVMQPLGRLLRGAFRLWRERRTSSEEELSRVIQSGESAMLFLKRPHTLFGWEPSQFKGAYVEELIRIQRGQRRPIIFVPLTLLWGSPAVRAARSRRGIVDIIFGEREAPGRLRALFTFFKDYKDSQVLVGDPLELPPFLDEELGPDELIARKLRWLLGGRIESEIRVVLGPPRKNVRRIGAEVLRGRRLIAEAQPIAAAEKLTPAQLQKRATAILREIAADPKPWMFDVGRPALDWIFGRIFDGLEVDEAGLEKVRAAAKKGPLIIVPSHKSHIDYLVLSYLFISNDLVPPLVAAGANLSFWPLGFFFRRGGAFFLRRSFKGDKLYGAVFRAYVRKLLRESFNIEFFIEGGRSRTGKLLQPKLGLLGMMVDAALDDDGAHARRAHVVPISIGYEKVIEEKAYASEAAGGEKKKEDMKGLLKATRVLGAEYGRLNVQFDDPLPLLPALREYGALAAWDEDENVVVAAELESVRQATQRLAHRIVYGIDRVTAVTTTALMAAALLATGKRGTLRRDLLQQAQFLMERARAGGARLSASLLDEKGELNAATIDRAIELCVKDGDVEVRQTDDTIYTIPDERRPRLAYYRNNAIHLFVAEGLVALALGGAAKHGLVAVDDLRERTLRLSRLLKLEFTYRVGETFENIFGDTLEGMQKAGLVAKETHGVHPAPGQTPQLALLGGQVIDFVESYLIAARGLQLVTAPMTDKELVKRIHEVGEKMFFTGEVRRREACVRANYVNAVAYFKERGVIVERDKKLALAAGVDARRIAGEIADLLPPAA